MTVAAEMQDAAMHVDLDPILPFRLSGQLLVERLRANPAWNASGDRSPPQPKQDFGRFGNVAFRDEEIEIPNEAAFQRRSVRGDHAAALQHDKADLSAVNAPTIGAVAARI